jgi:hypothetical protein
MMTKDDQRIREWERETVRHLREFADELDGGVQRLERVHIENEMAEMWGGGYARTMEPTGRRTLTIVIAPRYDDERKRKGEGTMTLDQAERAIADVLRRLEIDTGCVVDAISTTDIEVTTVEDERRQVRRRVVIELKRLPGQSWD